MKLPKLYCLLWFLAGLTTVQGQSPEPLIDAARITLAYELRPSSSSVFINNDANLSEIYPALNFKKGVLRGPVSNKNVTRKALVRFRVFNSSDSVAGLYFFPGFFCTDIDLFRDNNGQVTQLPDSLPPILEKTGYRYFSIAPGDSMTIIASLSFLKTYNNKMRPRLVHPQYINSFLSTLHNNDSASDIMTYIFCGLLLMMILYSIASFFLEGNREFLYYSGYALLLGFMLLTKALFGYHTDRLSFFFEEYLDFILQSLGVLFYMMFMQRFLNTRQQHRFLYKFYNTGILLIIISVLAYSYFHYGTDNFPVENAVENGTKILLLLMVIIFLVYSLRHWKDKLLRYLFWGNLLFLLFSVVSMLLIVAPGIIPYEGIATNSLFYYEAGLFFELVLFLAGLNHKNRRLIIEQTREKEVLRAQNLLKEYEKEMAVYKAQQEERERISADMHDELGSGMTAIRLMSEIARNKMKESTPVEIEKISESADDVLNKMNAIIWSMNSSNDTLDSLVLYLRSYALEYFESTDVQCRITVPEKVPSIELTGEKRRNVFLCVKESLNNILKHAKATLVKIDVEVNHSLKIIIKDNGVGADLDKARPFGNGLKNMNRRMETIGGTFQIRSDGGTIITIELPL